VDTEKSNWTWDAEAGAYYWHRFYSHQPDLNFDNPAVLEEVLSVMRFWVDLGVDGLRLDAVPYLIEREGTNNENLPETHAVLKRLRAELDRHAPGKMLLCEANQWPEDAQVYFGDADECHMSFHFPLMPRMYMAIAREDRFPITDILRQTPDIPPSCQWAIFLRNHDELTLEMVTDSERDELWETYASDRRARLNLGIRRRLAPLLQHDRRRMELMNALLLSMPGTPVIYYGDEIGMGDNIHLGDRDGVRTPMQWSSDRNGGFSRADTASLVLPVITDPLYGYQAVNVEAQSSDQHSPLNWMRRMLAVRQRFAAFGRGTLRFLYPGNRKVMAYLREGGEDVLLCVCNLSRAAQAVELDLSAFEGRVAVELMGGAVFPAVGGGPYVLTLPPYGFYWFLLATQAALPPWHTPAPRPLPELATLVLRRGIADVTLPGNQTVIEREVLPAYLPRRRWFAAKTEVLIGARLAYTLALPGTPDVLLAEISAHLASRQERYVVPLAIVWESEGVSPLAQALALSRVRKGARVGLLTDGFAADGFATGVLARLRAGEQLPLPDGGTLRFEPTSRMATLDLADPPGIRRLSAEQSNSSLIVDDAVVLKVVRRVSAGIHPEGEMTRLLTERGFGNTAPLLGEVVRIDADGTPSTLMIAQGFVRNQGDGWSWTLDALSRAAQDVGVTEAGDVDAETDALAPVLAFAANLGRRLAEMHAVLTAPSEDPAFAPDVADEAILDGWAESAAEQLALACDLLEHGRDWTDEATRDLARRIVDARDALTHAVRRLARAGHGALQTRIHGDFHLGQVLVVQGDAVIIDFEGEPARPLEQRRAKSCGLRDLAGLLRSFDYAAATAARATVAASPVALERRPAVLARFRAETTERAMTAYREVLRGAERAWVPASAEAALLDLFMIEKAAYEIRYEAENRPDWLPIPLTGLAGIAERIGVARTALLETSA
jgi:maltose alpha-D-glucosyltransferase/alpha-amylase